MTDTNIVCQNWTGLVMGLFTAHHHSLVALATLIGLLLLGILWILAKRQNAKWRLEQRGLPTVLWRPRFINYGPRPRFINYGLDEEQQKLSSSTITRMLPRMERLAGPFGMYGTIYGLTTQVIHVAHPIPARAIFGTSTLAATSSSNRQQRRRSSILESTGASKAPAYDHFKNFCGDGVFTADGEDWKAKRTAVMHCLIKGSNSATTAISQRLEHEANRAADTFISQVSAQASQQKGVVVTTNVVPLLQRSTVGLIYRFITHHEPTWAVDLKATPNTPDVPSNDDTVTMETTSVSSADTSTGYASHGETDEKPLNAACAASLLETYMNSIIRIRMIILAQSRSIWFLLPRWCYQTFSSLYQDEEVTLMPIRHFAQQACANAQPGSPLAQLRGMASHNKTINATTIQSSKPDASVSKDLLDEAITLLFAGQDTSAATLSWTLHLLSLHPDIQTKLVQELRDVLTKEGVTGSVSITRKLIPKFIYLDAVIKESMRLYPVAPFVVRRIMDDLSVGQDGTKPTTVLPAGSIACIWIYGLHRNPALWNRPDEFVPNRWLDPQLKDVGQTNGAYIPFAAGPRNCVGQPIANVVLRTLLARLLIQFDFQDDRLATCQDPNDLRKDMQAGFTVLPSGGVTLSIRTR